MQNRIYTPSGMSFRRISEVAEVVGMEGGVVQLNKIFQWNPELDAIENVGMSSKTLSDMASLSGYSLAELYQEIENRKLVLEHMLNYNMRSVGDVKNILEAYYMDSQKVLNKVLLNG